MAIDKRNFENLVSEANQHPFSGWDFSFISDRMRESALHWNYRQRVRDAFGSVQTVLDIGTGGGEFLASLKPLPLETYATEAYVPNIPIAKAILEPLGVRVEAVESDYHLPFLNDFFDLVINRHEKFIAEEIARILKHSGRLITQQVGERNLPELNRCLRSKKRDRPSYYQRALAFLQQSGFEVIESREAFSDTVFYDVGAIVYFLKAIPWQVPDFSTKNCYDQLRAIHDHIQANGKFITSSHRFYIEARKP